MPTLTHTYQRQQTGWFCGPAAVRVALSCRGILPSQTELAASLGTTTAGTDSSADVVQTMNGYLGAATYAARFLPGQTASEAEIATLKADLIANIDAGYAIVANVVGTIRPLDGGSYSYPGGHYVTAVGYRASGDEVFVADVAQREYWTTTEALAIWIAARGYSYRLAVTTLYVDVSNHDRDRRGAPLDWGMVAAAGLNGVMCAKVSEGDPARGDWYNDPWFAEMQAGARAAGYTARGGYHCIAAGDQASIARQVDALRTRLDAQGCTWGMVDVEPFSGLVAWNVVPRWEDLLRFNDRWYALDSRVLAWYVPRWFWDVTRKGPNLGSPDLRALRGPLVASAYPDGAGTAQQVYGAAGGDGGSGWNAYGNRAPEIWQYTSSADVPGSSARTDVNAYRGTLAELAAVLGGTAAPIGEPEMQMLVRFADGPEPDQVWLVDGMLRRRVPPEQLAPGHIGNDGVHNQGVLGNLGYSGTVFVSGWADREAWGTEYPPPAGSVVVDPAVVRAAVRAELDDTRFVGPA